MGEKFPGPLYSVYCFLKIFTGFTTREDEMYGDFPTGNKKMTIPTVEQRDYERVFF